MHLCNSFLFSKTLPQILSELRTVHMNMEHPVYAINRAIEEYRKREGYEHER